MLASAVFQQGGTLLQAGRLVLAASARRRKRRRREILEDMEDSYQVEDTILSLLHCDSVPRRIGVNIEAWKVAAGQGHAYAQYNLGVCYEHGQGVPQDMQKAAKYHKLAAVSIWLLPLMANRTLRLSFRLGRALH